MNNLDFPPLHQKIMACAGLEAVIALSLAQGGQPFYFPRKAKGSLLSEIVGIDAARKIIEADIVVADYAYIPSIKRQLNRIFRERGASQKDRGLKLKVSYRTIQNWDASDNRGRQPGLFDLAG